MEIEKIKKVLERHREIIFSYLFGSFAKGLKGKESDIDIGIFLKKNFKKVFFMNHKLH